MKILRNIKRIIITIAGSIVIFIGVLLIFLPGPAFIIIPLGLAILALEYDWAKKLFLKLKSRKKKNE